MAIINLNLSLARDEATHSFAAALSLESNIDVGVQFKLCDSFMSVALLISLFMALPRCVACRAMMMDDAFQFLREKERERMARKFS
jgi:hypothetical protein